MPGIGRHGIDDAVSISTRGIAKKTFDNPPTRGHPPQTQLRGCPIYIKHTKLMNTIKKSSWSTSHTYSINLPHLEVSNCWVLPRHVGVSGRRLQLNQGGFWQFDGSMTSHWSQGEYRRSVRCCDGARRGDTAFLWLIVMVGSRSRPFLCFVSDCLKYSLIRPKRFCSDIYLSPCNYERVCSNNLYY